MPANGLLNGLVDDPHAAPADLAQDLVFAELLQRRWCARFGASIVGKGLVDRAGLEALDDLQRWEELENVFGPLGVFRGVLGGRRLRAAAEAVEELIGEPLKRIAIGGGRCGAHGKVS